MFRGSGGDRASGWVGHGFRVQGAPVGPYTLSCAVLAAARVLGGLRRRTSYASSLKNPKPSTFNSKPRTPNLLWQFEALNYLPRRACRIAGSRVDGAWVRA